ncbi:MAG: HD domain-containing phosphohydrolase [Candidatus Omnitrophota bacterium]
MSSKDYYKIAKALVLALEARAYYLRGHSERVTRYALLLAKKLKLTKEQTHIISSVGKIHDLGKIALSDIVLNKKGSLTPSERKQINLHPLIGAMMLKNLGFLTTDIQLVRNHHERYDGSGYPDGLKNYNIPLLARVFGVADAYDAMTSDRPYRKKMTRDSAIEELARCQGTQFDPIVVTAFYAIG